jgi:hypothetical protein
MGCQQLFRVEYGYDGAVLQVSYVECCDSTHGEGVGPIFSVPAGGNVEFTFPQPWTITNQYFAPGCLTISDVTGSRVGVAISIVGYTL